ncbi:MAG: calcium-binding protein, partial [Tagaea sp.]
MAEKCRFDSRNDSRLSSARSGELPKGDTMATITGTAGDDTMAGANSADWYFGLDGNDSIFGGNGNDTLEGGLGADTLDGGAGIDWISYKNATSGVVALLDWPNQNGGEAAGDVYFNVENILGSAWNDNLQGSTGNNTIEGGLGADVLAGGGGIDTVSYINAGAAIAVDLSTSSGSAGEAAGDILYEFENVIGSRFADTIVGTAGDNVILGRGGADYMDAGAGSDWASYETTSVASGVTVSLATGTGTQGDANGDTLIGFENLRGSKRADTLTGDA